MLPPLSHTKKNSHLYIQHVLAGACSNQVEIKRWRLLTFCVIWCCTVITVLTSWLSGCVDSTGPLIHAGRQAQISSHLSVNASMWIQTDAVDYNLMTITINSAIYWGNSKNLLTSLLSKESSCNTPCFMFWSFPLSLSEWMTIITAIILQSKSSHTNKTDR